MIGVIVILINLVILSIQTCSGSIPYLQLLRISGPQKISMNGASISPNGEFILVGDGGSAGESMLTLLKFNGSNYDILGSPLSIVRPSEYSTFTQSLFSPDSSKLIIPRSNILIYNPATVTDFQTSIPIQNISKIGYNFIYAAISGDGTRLFASTSGETYMYELNTTSSLFVTSVPPNYMGTGGVRQILAASPNGMYLASISGGNTRRVNFRKENVSRLGTYSYIISMNLTVEATDYSPVDISNDFLVFCQRNTLRIFHTANLTSFQNINTLNNTPYSLKITKDGSEIFVGFNNGRVLVYKKNSSNLYQLEYDINMDPSSIINDLDVSLNASYIVAAGGGGVFKEAFVYSTCSQCNLIGGYQDGVKCITCYKGQYRSGNSCLSCNSNCGSCQNSETNCLTCNPGKYLMANICNDCSTKCLTCQSLSTRCLTCNEKLFLNEATNQCWQRCDSNCLTCSIKTTQCMTCSDGMELDIVKHICVTTQMTKKLNKINQFNNVIIGLVATIFIIIILLVIGVIVYLIRTINFRRVGGQQFVQKQDVLPNNQINPINFTIQDLAAQ